MNNSTTKIKLAAKEIARDNHYIPQMYLNGWSNDGKHLWMYRVLAFNENCPIWQLSSIKSTGLHKNLYTRIIENEEYDDFETMFNKRFETPADAPLKAARQGERLSADDWSTIIRYMCAQLVRTPAFYVEWAGRISKIVENAITEVANDLQHLKEPPKLFDRDVFAEELIPLSVTLTDYDEDHAGVEIHSNVGKGYWLYAAHRLLKDDSDLIRTLCSFKWSIVDAPDGASWPTCDSPFVMAALCNDGSCKYVSAIGQASILLFPISPKKLILTYPKCKQKPRFTASEKDAALFKRLIVQNALLYVYSNMEDTTIQSIRPRCVDAQEAKRLRGEFDSWYRTYRENEAPHLQKKFRLVDKRNKSACQS